MTMGNFTLDNTGEAMWKGRMGYIGRWSEKGTRCRLNFANLVQTHYSRETLPTVRLTVTIWRENVF